MLVAGNLSLVAVVGKTAGAQGLARWLAASGISAQARRLSALLGFSAVFLACGSSSTSAPVHEPKPCEVQVVSLTILAASTLNPTEQDESRAVVLRIYQLKDDVQFQGAAFESLWRDDRAVLGADLVKVDEVTVYPRSRTEVQFARNPEARHVVTAALFREHQGRSWYTGFALPPGGGECCASPGCSTAEPNPRFSLMVEGTQVTDGSGRAWDEAEDPRTRVVILSTHSAGGTAASPASSPRKSR